MTEAPENLQQVHERYAAYRVALANLEAFFRDYSRMRAEGKGGLWIVSRKTALKRALAKAFEALRDAVFIAGLLTYDNFSDKGAVIEVARKGVEAA